APSARAAEEGPAEPAGTHRADRGVDSAGDHLASPPRQARCHSHSASSFVQYETMKSAPARLIAVSDSSAACGSSSQPDWAAALSIAYSPETLYAPTGSSNRSRTARRTSRYGSAGLTIKAAAA